MRISASAFFQIASAYSHIKKPNEAEYNYRQASQVFKAIIIFESKSVGKEIDANTITFEQLVQPSIFDNEDLKDLKEQLKEILERIEDMSQEDQSAKQIEKIKQQEKEQLVVDANFGKPMPNADQFKMMTFKSKIGEKRPYNQMLSEQKTDDPASTPLINDAESLKRKNLGDGSFSTGSLSTKGIAVVEAESNSSDKENTSKNTI